MKQLFTILSLLILCPALSWAQYSVCGTVLLQEKKAAGVMVSLLEGKDSVRTNNVGAFCLSNVSAGAHLIEVVTASGVSKIFPLMVDRDMTSVKLVLKANEMKTVTVQGLTEQAERSQHSIKTEVVDLAGQRNSSVTVEQLLNRTAGVRVRNTGGLGADADIVVGGFSGKSIKFLINGIPIDYLGSSMGLTKIPTDAADFLEVYKGVMPTEVGIDALGGAINIVKSNPAQTRYSVSYELGSFGLNRLSADAFIRKSLKYSFGFNLFGNLAKNNFKVNHLPMEDEATGQTEYITARLFHNEYRQLSGEAFFDIENRKWADLLQFKIDSYGLHKDIQNDFSSRSRPFGKVFREEHAYFVPSIRYKKDLFSGKLKLDQFLVYSAIESNLTDSLKNERYNWKGASFAATSGSEMGIDYSNLTKPVVTTNLQNLTYRGLFKYDVGNRQQLILNVVNNYFVRKADDLNSYHSRTQMNYNRFITGLGYQYQILDNRIEGLTQVKWLSSNANGSLPNAITGREEQAVSNSGFSFAQSIKYTNYTGWLLRASFENTYRLPDQAEIFGDNTFVLPNVTLKPERSLNVNIGATYTPNRRYRFEANIYHRNIEDLIRLKDINQFQALYLNLDKVKGYGVELQVSLEPVENFTLSGNLTYNGFRFQGSNDALANNEHFIDARVSNMPYYFGNAQAVYLIPKLFGEKDNLRVYWNYTYVHQFYLDFVEKALEPDGFWGLFGDSKVYTSRVIPVQQVHTIGFVWTKMFKNNHGVSVSSELDNLLNRPVYNAFKMQSMGRNVSLKLRYQF